MYAQDAWKASDQLTLNFGLGYSIDTPMLNHQLSGLGVSCFIIGEQSKIFTGAPKNLVYPGDPGCTNAGQATMHYGEFGPRLGFAWSPDMGRLSGGPGKLSIRGGFGIYYNRTEEESSLQTLGTPPFGFTSAGAADFGGKPQLANPYADINSSTLEANRFPYAQPTAGSPVKFSLPIFNISGFSPTFRAPYAENFQLSVERELPSKIVARISYVGSLGRRNQTAMEANPETPAGHAACLATQDCIDNQDDQALDYPANKLSGSYTGIIEQGSVGSEASANYSALQASVTKGETHGLLFQLSYTYGHSKVRASEIPASAATTNTSRRSTMATRASMLASASSSARSIPFRSRKAAAHSRRPTWRLEAGRSARLRRWPPASRMTSPTTALVHRRPCIAISTSASMHAPMFPTRALP
jgi:hypothetical protein